MDNRRLILAVLLSWAVVFAWSTFFSPKDQPVPTEEVGGAAAGEPRGDRSGEGERPAVPAVAADEEATTDEGEAVAAGAEPAPASIEASQEAIEQVEGDRFVAELSNRGGQIVSFRLKDQLDADDQPMELVRRRTGNLYPFGLVDGESEGLAINDALFSVERSGGGGEPTVLTFSYAGQSGRAEKRFVFGDEGLFDFDISYGGADDWGVILGPGVANPSELELEQQQFWRGGVYKSGDELERLNARKKKIDTVRVPGRAVSWAALDDRYFLSAVVPSAGVGEVVFEPVILGSVDGSMERLRVVDDGADLSDDEKKEAKALALVLVASGDRVEGKSYWGAKVFDQLAALPYGFQESVDYGWFSFLARPLQLALKFIYERGVHNYGWAIVLMTIGIKLLLLPLTHQSMVSSQKMQLLNPKIQAIRAKYRSKLKDRQGRPNVESQREMQNEIMGLYKAEGVNPASGCLPVVLQIPVFFAFYRLLGAAIELRHAPWVGWIQDLSLMDPHYVLPVIMFGTQFIQQLRMPMGTDPMQRRLFLMMPFIFLFVFLKFPAGLVLYWLTNNVFSILQQEFYKLLKAKREAAAVAGTGKGDGSGQRKGKKRSANP